MQPSHNSETAKGNPVRTTGLLFLGLALIVALLAIAPRPASGSDTSTRWTNFSESSGCGQPWTGTPYVSKEGGLSGGEPILGPFGTYFGRSVDDVRQQLITWTVPYSGGRTIRVHRAMLPSLQQVANELAAEAAGGRTYWISAIGGFTPRTIGGSHRISRHALGLAIDINPAQNPFRADNKLITDMPQWFVDVWRRAGFCWGGDWQDIKDPMHFSWMGPAAGGVFLEPLPSKTSRTAFGQPVASHSTAFAPVVFRYRFNVTDGIGNGAPDVVGVRDHPDGAVIDITSSSGGYGVCSVTRWFVPAPGIHGATHVLFGDVDGDSRQDLIALDATEDGLHFTVATRAGEFKDVSTGLTAAGADAVAVAAADFDGDTVSDLWDATPDGRLRIWQGPAWINLIHDEPFPSGAPSLMAAADRDGDDKPELFALYSSTVEVLRHDGGWWVEQSLAVAGSSEAITALGAVDYDGDGRSDIETLDTSGRMTVRIGNTPTGVPASRWFLHPDPECDDEEVPLSFNGTFFDDESSIFEANIESIAFAGITRGCNPPFGDMFCPRDLVTRETMAAFLVRGLGLTQNEHPGFGDVPPDSIFAQDIGILATAGITIGCSPSGDRFCPKDLVARQEMAAFISRALSLEHNTHPGFGDVPPNSIFAEDIGRLATAGITLGCSPSGDQYCPFDAITREAMAAFLDRAGLGHHP